MKNLVPLIVLVVTLATTAPLRAGGEPPPKVVETWPESVPGLNCPFEPYDKIPRRQFAKWGDKYVDAFLIGGGRFESPEVSGTIAIDWVAEQRLIERDFQLGSSKLNCLHEETSKRRLLGQYANCTGLFRVGDSYLITISIRALKPSAHTHMVETFASSFVDANGKRDGRRVLAWRKEAGRSVLLALETFARQALAGGGTSTKEELKVSIADCPGGRGYAVEVRVANERGEPAANRPVALYVWGDLPRCYFVHSEERNHPEHIGRFYAAGGGLGLRTSGRTDAAGRFRTSLLGMSPYAVYMPLAGSSSADMSSYRRAGPSGQYRSFLTLSGHHLAETMVRGLQAGHGGIRTHVMARVEESEEGPHATCRAQSVVWTKSFDFVARVVDLRPSKHPKAKPTWLVRSIQLPGEEKNKRLAIGDRLRPDDVLKIRQWESVELEFVVVSYPGFFREETEGTRGMIVPVPSVLKTNVVDVPIFPTRYGSGFRTWWESARNRLTRDGCVIAAITAGTLYFSKDPVKTLGMTALSAGTGIALAIHDNLKPSDPVLLNVINSSVLIEAMPESARTLVVEGAVEVYKPGGDAPVASVPQGRYATYDLEGKVLESGSIEALTPDPVTAALLNELGAHVTGSAGAELEVDARPFRFGIPTEAPAFDRADWPRLARHVRDLSRLLRDVRQSAVAGTSPPANRMDALIRENEALAAFSTRMGADLGVEDTNRTYTHPAVAANLLGALLRTAEKPLTPEQRRKIQEAGASWVAFAAKSQARIPSHAPALARLHADVDGKLRFLGAVKGLLTPEQRLIAFNPETEGRLRLDILSPVLVYVTARPVRAGMRDEMARSLVQELMTAAGFKVESLRPWRAAAYAWLEALGPAALRTRPAQDVDVLFPHVQELQRVAWIQAQATHRIAQTGGLSEQQVKALREVEVLLVPHFTSE